jgi:nicotinamidase/pyrazinamidase
MVEKKLFTITPGKEPQMVLLIVDAQNDFIEDGALPVAGARDSMNRLAEYIKNNYQKYSLIVFTVDWHPQTHCSFTKNKGQWPTHCVQFSNGAAIYQPLLDVLDENNIDYIVLTKGTNEDREEYSIFKNPVSKMTLTKYNEANKFEFVDVAGLALDYCVKDSISDGKKVFTNSKFRLLKDCTAAIGKPEETYDVIINNEVEII